MGTVTVIICQLCGYQSGRISNLRRHTKAMHQGGNQVELNCCNESFADKAKYREHCRTAHKNGHECQACFRVFTRKALLRRHQSVHTGFKEFGCQLCTYATSHKSNLERHFKIHAENSHSSARRHSRYSTAASSSSFIRSQKVTHAATKNVGTGTNLVKKQNKGIHPGTSISTAATVMKGRRHRRFKNSLSDSEQPDSTSTSASSSTNMNPTISLNYLKIESPQQCPVLRTMLGSGSSSISPVLSSSIGPPSTLSSPQLKTVKLSHSIESILGRPSKNFSEVGGSQFMADVKQEGFNDFTVDHNNMPKYYEEPSQPQLWNQFSFPELIASNFTRPSLMNPYFQQYTHMPLTTTTTPLPYTMRPSLMSPYPYYQQYEHMLLTTTTPLPYTMSHNQSQTAEDLRIQSHYYSAAAPINFEETLQGKHNTNTK